MTLYQIKIFKYVHFQSKRVKDKEKVLQMEEERDTNRIYLSKYRVSIHHKPEPKRQDVLEIEGL